MPARALIPPAVSGYALGTKRGYFRVIRPEATENIADNPSFEHPYGALAAPTGYGTTTNATILQSLTYSWRGYKVCAVAQSQKTEEGIYKAFSATAGQPYTFSADLRGNGGQNYRLYFADNAGTRVGGVTTVKSRGRWQRPSVTFYAPTTATYRVYLTRASTQDAKTFYTEGWQIENKPYATTYCDGSLTGFVLGQAEYFWKGAPDQSASVRVSQCRAGGREIDLRDYYFDLLGYVGLGDTGRINYLTPLSSGGAYYQGSNVTDREFSVLGSIRGDGQPLTILQRINEIRKLIGLDAVAINQPALLLFNPYECDMWDEECLEVVGIPQDSLTESIENYYQLRGALSFRIPTVYTARACGEESYSLSHNLSVSNANRILKRDADGLWSTLSTGATAGASTNSVRWVERLPNGLYLVLGDFAALGGVANTAGAGVYNPATNSFATIFTGAGFGGTATANSASVGPDGNVYIVGAFTSVDAVANTGRVAAWNYITGVWSSVANPSSSGPLEVVLYAANGGLYVGGPPGFTIGGVVVANQNVAYRNPAGVWSNVSAFNVTATDIKAAPDGTIYIAENFSGLYTWDGATLTLISPPVGASPQQIAFHPDGRLYIATTDTSIGGVSANRCAYYNGSTYFPLGAGFDNNALWVFYSAQDGLIYYSGTYTAADSVTLPDSASAWNGSAHIPLDVDLPSTGNVYSVYSPSPDYLFVGYSTAGTATAAAVNTIVNRGTNRAYPVLTITGPGRLFQIKNYTTKVGVYFNLTLLAGEVATLDFAAIGGPKFTSSFRGDLMGYVTRGSNTDLYLLPGTNKLSLFITGDTAATNAHLVFRPTYNAIEGWASERTA